MADYNPAGDLEGASDYSNMLARQDAEVRKTNAYNALAKIYGPIAGDPEAATADASAQTAMANAPNMQAANTAKAQALVAAQQQFGPSAGNPEAQTTNLSNQEAAGQNQRQAQFRGLQMLKTVPPRADGSIDPDQFDRIVGANAKTLGLDDPDQLAAFKANVTAPGGSAHLDDIGQALLAPTKVTGAPIYTDKGVVFRNQYGNMTAPDNPGGATTVQQERAVTGQKNAVTAAEHVPIAQQNANTAAYSANTRSNNSNFGNPDGQATASPTRTNPGGSASAANTHVGNPDGTATTPTFDKLAPVGSKARSNAIDTATGIKNADIQLQNTNNVIGQLSKQISPYTAGVGSLLKNLPASDQANVKANLAAIQASGLMSFIQSVKAGGPGGTGGLRLTSEANAAMALYGNMEQDQTAPQLALHLKLFQTSVNQLHQSAQSAFKAKWGQDPYALIGTTPASANGAASPPDKVTAAAYAKYGIN